MNVDQLIAILRGLRGETLIALELNGKEFVLDSVGPVDFGRVVMLIGGKEIGK